MEGGGRCRGCGRCSARTNEHLCMVEDLNDDEVMELCIPSNELNACETTATLIPSKFASLCDEVGTP